MPVLKLQQISKHFGAIHALTDVSLTLDAGEVVGLMGDNGAGKSTLVKIIAGNFRPSAGQMFIGDDEVELIGVEAAGEGLGSGRHSASIGAGSPGVLHGSLSYLLQDDDGQVREAHSVSAGLDYPGVGPEHSWLADSGRARYYSVTDEEALEAFGELSRLEGIVPALETAHALAWVRHPERPWAEVARVLVCLSGRGDKDVAQVAARAGAPA